MLAKSFLEMKKNCENFEKLWEKFYSQHREKADEYLESFQNPFYDSDSESGDIKNKNKVIIIKNLEVPKYVSMGTQTDDVIIVERKDTNAKIQTSPMDISNHDKTLLKEFNLKANLFEKPKSKRKNTEIEEYKCINKLKDSIFTLKDQLINGVQNKNVIAKMTKTPERNFLPSPGFSPIRILKLDGMEQSQSQHITPTYLVIEKPSSLVNNANRRKNGSGISINLFSPCNVLSFSFPSQVQSTVYLV